MTAFWMLRRNLVRDIFIILMGGLAHLLVGSPASLGNVPFPEAEIILADTTAVPVVHPGGPQESSREREVARAFQYTYTQADVDFMQGMIIHHAQALEMTEMVSARSARQDLRQLAYRIEIGQTDEIRQMVHWLEDRGEPTSTLPPIAREALGQHDRSEHEDEDNEHHAGAHRHHHEEMHGMLSPEQLSQLRAAFGNEFDRLFLEFMIFHHEGAIIMVEELFRTDNAAQDSEVYTFASHVQADQSMEISRMHQMLSQLD